MSKLLQKRFLILVVAWGGFGAILCEGLPLRQSWADFISISHSQYQAVQDDGTAAWPSGGGQPYAIELIGVVLNNPWDMLDYSLSTEQPEWQVFIQAVDPNDFGGTALYMRQKIPWNPSQDYTNDEWTAEMSRINYPDSVTEPLRRGDRIKVQALAPGLFYNGKYNINEQHQKDPSKNFYITILQRNVPLSAASITLADLKDAGNNFIFDQTRQTGCEHYQGSLVHLDGLLLVDPEHWTLDGTVTVRQGNLTVPMKLGTDPGLAAINASLLATTPFSATAILDQEDSTSPYTGGYRLWLTNAADLGAPLEVIPEPSSVVLAGFGLALVLFIHRFWKGVSL